MDRTFLREHLALVEQSVRDGVRHIERQRQLIDKLQRAGRDSTTARELLRSLEQSQSTHLEKRDQLRQELGESPT
jgi:hypothetical protein